jgi:hypothetical protein
VPCRDALEDSRRRIGGELPAVMNHVEVERSTIHRMSRTGQSRAILPFILNSAFPSQRDSFTWQVLSQAAWKDQHKTPTYRRLRDRKRLMDHPLRCSHDVEANLQAADDCPEQLAGCRRLWVRTVIQVRWSQLFNI